MVNEENKKCAELRSRPFGKEICEAKGLGKE
jgi:hypothetical protein